MFKKIGLITISAVSAFAMHTAEINVNDIDLEFSAKFDMGQFNNNTEPNTVFLGAKYLNAKVEHSDIETSDANYNLYGYYELNFLMQKEMNDNFSLGLGVKLNRAEKFATVPLGIEAAYKLPISSSVPLYIGASVYYASEALSMADATGFLEYRAGLEAEVIQNAHIVVGYRSLNTYYQDLEIQYNRSIYAGFKFIF